MSNATDTSTTTGPVLQLVIEDGQYVLDGNTVIVPDGSVHQVAMEHIAAAATGPVQVRATDGSAVYQLLVNPDGSVTALPDVPATSVPQPPAARRGGTPARVKSTARQTPTTTTSTSTDTDDVLGKAPDDDLPDNDVPHTNEPDTPVRDAAPPAGLVVPAVPADVGFAGGAAAGGMVGSMAGVVGTPAELGTRADRRAARESVTFLPGADEAFAGPVAAPAVTGWAGVLQRLGLRRTPAGPTPEQLVQREELRAIAQHWAGPRTIAVVNPKGGAGKTPTTIALAAMFARWGGAGCVAWDNNQTRGTMGWRTEQGPHTAHVRDLLAAADELMRPSARAADMAGYVHHQTEDKFDVLRSNPHSIAPQERLTAADLDLLHQVAARYYRLIFIDSGNDESAPNWLQMIEHTDQLVVATTTRPDHAEAARLVLDELHEQSEASATLANDAVVIVAHADQSEEPATAYLDRFGAMARAACSIPYDPGMRAAHLRLDGLRPDTQDAWRHAAALVAAGLGTGTRS